MTDRRRPTVAAAAFATAGCLLFAACGNSTPAAQRDTPTVKAAAGSSPVASVAPTDRASSEATVAAAPTGKAEACALVTQQEVGTALGKDPGRGSAFTSHGASQCQYGSYQTALVLVNLNPSQGKPFYDHTRNNPKVSQAGAVTDVAGVGDRAFGIFGHGTASIYFNKGDALVLVMVEIRTASSPPKAQALALAKTAASRI
jgi:hypothetical protein